PLPAQTLDGQHALSRNLLDCGYTRPHRLVIHDYGARSAQGGAATELCAGEPEVITQHPEQYPVIVYGQLHWLAIQREGNVSPHRHLPSRRVGCFDSLTLYHRCCPTAVTSGALEGDGGRP